MGKKEGCKFCDKHGLRFLPLTYAVVTSTDKEALAKLPALDPGKLGERVSDIKLSEQAKYAVRLMPPGYLYNLIERGGVKYWQSYLVLEDAYLYLLKNNEPPQVIPEFNCDPSVCGIDASMIDIPDAKEVKNAWLLYSPSALTAAKLDEYRTNAEVFGGNGKMQHFSPADWLSGTTKQKHTLLATELLTSVVEYTLFTQPGNPLGTPLGNLLEQQMIPAIEAAYAGTPPDAKGRYSGRLGALYNKMKQDGYGAVVAFNPIGITQTLNDYRNAPLESVQYYLKATDEFGVDNQWRLQVHEAIKEIKAAFEKEVAFDLEGRRKYREHMAKRDEELAKKWHATTPRKQTPLQKRLELDNARRPEREAAEMADRWQKKYGHLLNEDEMNRFHTKLTEYTSKAFELAAKRAPDHLKWFESERLVDAFDAYDPADKNSGYSFAYQTSVCTLGVSGCPAYDDKLDAWIKAVSAERKNLYMRGFLFNNAELIKAAATDLPAIGAEAAKVAAASEIDFEKIRKFTKGLISGFKSLDSAFDEWVRKQGEEEFSRKWLRSTPVGAAVGKMVGSKALQTYGIEIMMFHKMSEITRTVFRSGMDGKMDKKLVAILGSLLHARMGKAAENFRLNELLLELKDQLEKDPPPAKLTEGHKGRSAERNEELARDKAARKSAPYTRSAEGSLETVLDDARAKVAAKVKPSLAELAGNSNPPINNYHHVRIGVLLGCLEMIGLGEKFSRDEIDFKTKLEIGGSVLAVTSIVYETLYASVKSVREIEPYKSTRPIEKGADILRGKYKFIGGSFGFFAGGISTYLDFTKFLGEKDTTLAWIYGLRAADGGLSTLFGGVAAFSYAGPWLSSIAKSAGKDTTRRKVLKTTAGWAIKLSSRVRLLVWVARFNWVGLALTAAEIGYLALDDNKMEAWCKMCAFRKKKQRKEWGGLGKNVDADHYPSMEKELAALDDAGRDVGLGGIKVGNSEQEATQ